MKKCTLFALLMIMTLFFSFDIIHAKVEQSDEAYKLSQIKEIRQSLKYDLKVNQKQEKQIEKKSKQIEKVLVKLPQNSLVSQQVIDEKISPRLEEIMSQLMIIGEYESDFWKHLKKANREIKNKQYNDGIKHLKQADTDLKNKQELMLSFENDLEKFLVFINSLQFK